MFGEYYSSGKTNMAIQTPETTPKSGHKRGGCETASVRDGTCARRGRTGPIGREPAQRGKRSINVTCFRKYPIRPWFPCKICMIVLFSNPNMTPIFESSDLSGSTPNKPQDIGTRRSRAISTIAREIRRSGFARRHCIYGAN